MKDAWMKPVFEELDVNGECTAYAGVVRTGLAPEETPSERSRASARRPEAAVPVDHDQSASARVR
jgi:hypothetical protein